MNKPEPRKLKAAAIECREHLEAAYKIATDEAHTVGWIASWITSKEEFEQWGPTVELELRVGELEAKFGNINPDRLEIKNLVDQKKFEFFVENFAKIPLSALEWVVSEVKKNKIAV